MGITLKSPERRDDTSRRESRALASASLTSPGSPGFLGSLDSRPRQQLLPAGRVEQHRRRAVAFVFVRADYFRTVTSTLGSNPPEHRMLGPASESEAPLRRASAPWRGHLPHPPPLRAPLRRQSPLCAAFVAEALWPSVSSNRPARCRGAPRSQRPSR